MPSTRGLTANQRAARFANAEKRKCPRCLRKAALSTKYELQDDFGRRIGLARECNYCGHEVGVRNGEPFGRLGVVPEPGVKK